VAALAEEVEIVVGEHGESGREGRPSNRATRQGFTRRGTRKSAAQGLPDVTVGRRTGPTVG